MRTRGGWSSRMAAGVLLAAAMAVTAGPPAADLQLSQSALDFGTVKVGRGAEAAVTLTNTGAGSARIDALPPLALGSPFHARIEERQLNPGASTRLHLSFAPATRGEFSGQLPITGKVNGLTRGVVLDLAGSGVGPGLTIDPPGALDFGAVPIGNSLSAAVTVTNRTRRMVTVHPTLPPVLFDGGGPLPTFDLDPNESRSLPLVFAPRARGRKAGRLRFQSEAIPGGRVDYGLIGRGAAALDVTPESVDFGVVDRKQPHERSIQVVNRSESIVRVHVNDALLPDRLHVDASPPTRLRPNEEMSLTVRLRPGPAGTVRGTLKIAGSTGEETERVFLRAVAR